MAEAVAEIAAEMGKSSAQVAIAWTLVNPAVCSPVIGARTHAQLEDNLGALSIAFSAGQIERLNAASAVAPVFPVDVLTGPAEAMMFGNVKVAVQRS